MRERSWIWRLAAIVAAVALALGLAACGDDDDEAADTAADTTATTGGTEINVAYVTTPQHPYGIAVASFAEEVNGTGAATLTPQASYPQSEIQLLDDVRSGAVPMASISSAVWDTAGVTAFQALQAPFLITSYGLEGEVINGEIGQSMIASANEEAPELQVLAIHEGGLRKPLGVEPLVALADWNGKTIRAPQSDVLAAGLQALGANADPVPLPEVYTALQNGTVDGMEANYGLAVTEKLYEVAPNFTANVNLWPFPTVLVMNKAAYDGLSDEARSAIDTAAGKIGQTSLDIFLNPAPNAPNFPQQLLNCDVKFLTATPAQRTQLTTAGQEATSQLAPESQDYVAQIQSLKESLPPPAAPPPLPTEKTGACGS
jgi:TRAP-type C4-dicarboxylate transport system substrate-binding protein